MTCIVGIKHGGKVFIGGDSCASNNYYKEIIKDKKIFHWNNHPDIVIGGSGSIRTLQLVKHDTTLFKDIDNVKVDEKWMVTIFIPRLITLFGKDSGCEIKDEDGQRRFYGDFLIGVKNKLFGIGSDFQVGELMDSFDSIGCGMYFALGSMRTSLKYKFKDINSVIKDALLSSEANSPFVQRPFYVTNTGDLKIKKL